MCDMCVCCGCTLCKCAVCVGELRFTTVSFSLRTFKVTHVTVNVASLQAREEDGQRMSILHECAVCVCVCCLFFSRSKP